MTQLPNITHHTNLQFVHLPAFISDIRQHYFREYVEKLIQLSREMELPLLRYFEDFTYEQLVSFSMTTTGELFDYLENDQAQQQIEDSLYKWINDQLPQIHKGQVEAEDITLVHFVRKQALLHFLPRYAADIPTTLAIVNEIDRFVLAAETSAFKVFTGMVGERLNEHLDYIEKIHNTIPGILYVFDMKTQQVAYANQQIQQLLGYYTEELAGMGSQLLENLVHPHDLQGLKAYLQQLMQAENGVILHHRHRSRHKNGSYRWMSNYDTIFKRDAEGKASHIIGISLDVDELQKTTEQLKRSQEQLLQAQQLANMGSFEWNLQTREGTCTPQLLQILGYSAPQQLNQFFDNVHPDDRQQVVQAVQSATRQCTTYNYECRYLTPQGEKMIWAKGAVSEHEGVPYVKGTIVDITERHQMLERLRSSDQLFNEAQALTHIGNWTWDIHEDVVKWSDELYRIYGLEPQSETITFEKFTQFIHPDDKALRLELLQHSLQTCEPAEYMFRIINRQGKVRILHGKSEVRCDNDGKAVKMFGTCQDVTEKQLLIEKLQESEQLFKQAQALSHIGNWSYDLVNKTIVWSDELYRIYEMEPGSKPLHLEELQIFNHPDDREMISAEMTKGYETGSVDFYYRIILPATGRVKILHARGETFYDEQGNPVKAVGTAQDVTETIETENRLREQEHFIKHIAEASPTILYLFDLEARKFIYVNREVAQVLGYEPEEIIELGDKVTGMYLHPEDDIKSAENYVRFSSSSNTVMHQFEARIKHRDGHWVWILTREIVFKRDKEGRPLQVLGSALDITRRKEMEQALLHKTLQLQQSNASLEEFAHIASHDLQEPLRKIATFGDRLQQTDNNRLSDEGTVFLGKIIHSARRMQQLINDVLSISTIAAERNFTNCNLESILDEVRQTLEHKIDNSKAVITSDSLPRANVNIPQFRQLFQNLISNSLKFTTPARNPRVTITHKYIKGNAYPHLNLQAGTQYLQIEFADNGIGFEDVFSEKIFAIFQRLNGHAAYEGTGIGLAICKKIVENHSGIIFAHGVPNQGARFTILLPA